MNKKLLIYFHKYIIKYLKLQKSTIKCFIEKLITINAAIERSNKCLLAFYPLTSFINKYIREFMIYLLFQYLTSFKNGYFSII